MKAFELMYESGSKMGMTEVVLVQKEEEVEEALANKVGHYRLGNPYSKITMQREIPLSRVKLNQLSITEFLMLRNLEGEEK